MLSFITHWKSSLFCLSLSESAKISSHSFSSCVSFVQLVSFYRFPWFCSSSLVTPAVGVASGLVLCGDISAMFATSLPQMEPEAGVSVADVTQQRSPSQLLGCKMKCGSSGRDHSRDFTVKGFVMTCCHWLNYISPLPEAGAFCSRLYTIGFSPSLFVWLSGFHFTFSFCFTLSVRILQKRTRPYILPYFIKAKTVVFIPIHYKCAFLMASKQ